MASLPLTVPQGSTETLASFASRLAAAQGEAMNLQCFLTDMRVRRSAVAAGHPSAVAKLAELGSADPDSLQRFTPERPRAGEVVLAAEALPATMMVRTQVSVCRACLRADAGPSDPPT